MGAMDVDVRHGPTSLSGHRVLTRLGLCFSAEAANPCRCTVRSMASGSALFSAQFPVVCGVQRHAT